jgi:hypothetical protein
MNTLLVITGIIANILSICLSLAAIWQVRKYLRSKAAEAIDKTKNFIEKI